MTKRVPQIVVILMTGIGIAAAVVSIWLSIYGHDHIIRLEWHRQFTAQFWNGELYPRWLPDSFEGFGSPTFYFYPPLVFWVGAIVTFGAALPPEYSNIVVTFLGYLFSIITIRIFLREITSERMVLIIGTLLYVLHPYRTLNVVVRSAISEHFAFVLMPLALMLFLYDDKLDPSIKMRRLFLGLFGWLGLSITHIPSLVCVGYAGLIFAIVSYRERTFRMTMWQIGALILAAGAAALYLIPAIDIRTTIALSQFFTPASFRSSSNYILLDIFSKNNMFALSMFPIFVLFLLSAVIFHRTMYPHRSSLPPDTKRFYYFTLGISLLVFLMQIPGVNDVLIHIIPGFAFVQFSWRWLMLVPFISVMQYHILDVSDRPHRSIDLYLVVPFTVLLIGASLYLQIFVRPYAHKTLVWKEAVEYMNPSMNRDAEAAYNSLRAHAADPFIGLDKPLQKNEQIVVDSTSNTQYQITSDIREQKQVTFHLQYYDLWRLRSENTFLPLIPDSIGRLTARFEAGKNNYTLYLASPRSKMSSEIISLVSIILIGVLFVFRKKIFSQ